MLRSVVEVARTLKMKERFTFSEGIDIVAQINSVS